VVPGYKAYVKADGTSLDLGLIAPTIVTGLANTLTLAGVTGALTTWLFLLQGGLSTMDRLRARALESFVLVQKMVGSVVKDGDGLIHFANDGWTNDLRGLTGGALDVAGSTWSNKAIPLGTNIKGWGATEAPRGALMHQMTISNGKITAYQCIVPTTWNASPKDTAGNNGAIEKAMIDAVFHTGGNYGKAITGQGGAAITSTGGVEVLRIAQSFDPCIACAIH
jgi:Ni,Fe-hydrogenase I large subunit